MRRRRGVIIGSTGEISKNQDAVNALSYPPILMSMVTGQKVVCIDDTFKPLIKVLYKHLPKAGSTYTVRSVYL